MTGRVLRAGDAVWVGRYDVGSAEWEDARRHGLGGSEVAAVLGISPYQSRFTLWHRKAGNLPPQGPPPLRLRVGQLVEDAVITLYTERTGATVRRTGMWANSQRPWQLAEPDRFVVEPGTRKPLAVVEAKTADSNSAWEWGPDGAEQHGFAWDAGTGQWLGQIPPYYVAQVQWYLDCFALPWCDLVVLIGLGEYRQYRVMADYHAAQYLREEAQRFLADVATGAQPPVDGSESTYQAIRDLHPDLDGTDVELPAGLAADFLDAKAALTRAEQRWASVRNRVADHMGSASTASLAGSKVAIRKAKGTTGRPWVEAARGAATRQLEKEPLPA